MVYLFRSMGTVWGVAASSTLIQNVLTVQLPARLEGIPAKEEVFGFQWVDMIYILTGG